MQRITSIEVESRVLYYRPKEKKKVTVGDWDRRTDTEPFHTTGSAHHVGSSNITSYRPRGRRDDMPPAGAIRLAADLRPSADGSAVRTSSVPIA